MGIEAMPRGQGVPTAKGICDDCGRFEVLPCDYERSPGAAWRVNEGQARRKLSGLGWTFTKGKLRCGTCEAKRKTRADATPKWLSDAEQHHIQEATVSQKEKTVTAGAFRQPTAEQRGDIIEMLVATYDRKAKRYRGQDTDKTVAEAVGNGCLSGWVAAIREENFGPSGENEEIAEIKEQICQIRERWQDSHNKFMTDLANLESRLSAVRLAVGPKAGR